MNGEKVYIHCTVGCLDHCIGLDYITWGGNFGDEPELYLETLHTPYHSLFHRIKMAYYHIIGKSSLDWDATLISIDDAKRMANLCRKYITDYQKWENRNNAA